MTLEESAALLGKILKSSRHTVFFGGAGVSVESGIPDFRSVDGLYNTKWKYPPETVLSHSFFESHTEEFYEFYREKMIALWAKPNPAHKRLAEWERAGKAVSIVTQNIDGLHQAAGSQVVYELHGSVHRNYCLRCGKMHGAEYIKSLDGPPPCTDCGGLVKPDVVLYEEGLNSEIVNGAIEAIKAADMLIIGGTSLSVYPASGYIDFYTGNKLVLINKTPTEKDDRADLLIHGSIGEVLGVVDEL